MKKIKLLFITSVLIITGFCVIMIIGDENYNNIESNKNHFIKENIENTTSFIEEINDYANTFEKNFILNSIMLIYDNTYDLEIDFTFTKKISEKKSSSLFLYYELNKKSIIYSSYITGDPKVYSPNNDELDVTKWHINLNQGLDELKKQLAEKNILSFKRITCHCYQNEWLYNVFFSNDYTDRIDISISAL